MPAVGCWRAAGLCAIYMGHSMDLQELLVAVCTQPWMGQLVFCFETQQ